MVSAEGGIALVENGIKALLTAIAVAVRCWGRYNWNGQGGGWGVGPRTLVEARVAVVMMVREVPLSRPDACDCLVLPCSH